jgi:glycosyltransferase involved in cell wall biosynthesis
LTAVKDQANLLRAFAIVRQTLGAATVELVGDGPLRPQLQQLATELGIGGSVHFHGSADHAALPPIYQAADAFVLSSRHEAQGMVALEAAACGAAVVGTRVGVVPELTQRIASPGDPAALARAVASTLDSRDALMVDGARERIVSEFGLETCADRFRRLYASIGPA